MFRALEALAVCNTVASGKWFDPTILHLVRKITMITKRMPAPAGHQEREGS